MRKSLGHLIARVFAPAAFIFSLTCCSAIDQVIHPDEKSASSERPSYEQLLNENYKGPKARVLVSRFVDKSARGRDPSRVGDGITEMLRNALLATNRYIIQARKSSDGVIRGQDVGDSGRSKKEEEMDLLIEGTVREFKPGVAGAGDETGGSSYVSIVVTMIDPRTNKMIATERTRGKAADVGNPTGRSKGALPEIFKDFSKTPMEKAIRIVIEESASFIVARTPPESYRVLPIAPPPQEIPKPRPGKPEATLPPQPPNATLKPVLPITQVTWSSVNLREGPGTNYKVVGNVQKGTSLTVLEDKGQWLHVRREDGSDAWVVKSATSLAPKPSPSPAPPPKPTPM
ncbi:MAG TPA: SH3 domain-containing protein [Thermodesulfobacteriota bacterium]|jgi:curli biogenesis system outer membrane secretion channel CsgG|nr:SH3 domain-containing protein [Thermodesulfobacteriota bacterium]